MQGRSKISKFKRALANILAAIMILSTIGNAYFQSRANEGTFDADLSDVSEGDVIETDAPTDEPVSIDEPIEVAEPAEEFDLPPADDEEEIILDAIEDEPYETDTEVVNIRGPTIIINYDAGVGGTVTTSQEIIDPEFDRIIANGSYATPNANYMFKNWTAENGDVVSEDPSFIPDSAELTFVSSNYTADADNNITVTYTANFVESASEFEKVIPNVIKVNVYVSEGAFDREVDLIVKQITERMAEYKDVEDALEEAEKEYEGAMAFDIHFEDVETGEEIEPAGPVRVDFEILKRALDRAEGFAEGNDAESDFEVLHLKEDNRGDLYVDEVVADTADESEYYVDVTTDRNDNATSVETSFMVDDFSIFVVVSGTTRVVSANDVNAIVYEPGARGDSGAVNINGTYYKPFNSGDVIANGNTNVTFRTDEYGKAIVPDDCTLDHIRSGLMQGVYFKAPNTNTYRKVEYFVVDESSNNADNRGFGRQQGKRIRVRAKVEGISELQNYYDNINAYDTGTTDKDGNKVFSGFSNWVGHYYWIYNPNPWWDGGMIEAKVYLVYSNEVPTPIHQNVENASFGPAGDNSPYFTVRIDYGRLRWNGPVENEKPDQKSMDEKGYEYYTYRSHNPSAPEGNKDLAAAFFNDVLLDPAIMPYAEDRAKFTQYFGEYQGRPNYVGYILKREGSNARSGSGGIQDFSDWHLDGFLMADPSYLVEWYEKDSADSAGTTYITGFANNKKDRFDPTAKDALKDFFDQKFGAGSGATATWTQWKDDAGKVNIEGTVIGSDGKAHKFGASKHDQWSGVDNAGLIKYQTIRENKFYVARFDIWFEDVSTGTLQIEKGLSGSYSEARAMEHTFTFRVLDGAGDPVYVKNLGNDNYVYDEYKEQNNTEIKVRGGSYATIQGIPAGRYTVQELDKDGNPIKEDGASQTIDDAAGFVVTYDGDVQAEIEDNRTTRAKVTNNYEPEAGTLTVKKIFTGDAEAIKKAKETTRFKIEYKSPTDRNFSTLKIGNTTYDNLSYADLGSDGTLVINNAQRGTYRLTETGEKGEQSSLETLYTITSGKGEGDKAEDTITSNAQTGAIEGITLQITNDYQPKTTEVTGRKVWNDNNNADENRPETIRVRLAAYVEDANGAEEFAGKKYTRLKTLNGVDLNSIVNTYPQPADRTGNYMTAGTWDIVFNESNTGKLGGIPEYTSDGKKILYRLIEMDTGSNQNEEVPEGGTFANLYLTTYSEDGRTITNTRNKSLNPFAAGDTGDNVPGHRKYVKKRGGEANWDGTYDLTLTVDAARGTEEEKAKVDILFISDFSGSMGYYDMTGGTGYDKRLNNLKVVLDDLLKEVGENEKLDARFAMVGFDGNANTNDTPFNDGYAVVNWTEVKTDADRTSFINEVEKYRKTIAGTNYAAGFREGFNMLNAKPADRKGTETFVVFISDGNPTFWYDTNGITLGTGQEGAQGVQHRANVKNAYNGMIDWPGQLTTDYFYSVLVGPDSIAFDAKYTSDVLKDINALVPARKEKGFYHAADKDKLRNAFAELGNKINTLAVSNVTVRDTLSVNAEFVEDDAALLIQVFDDKGVLVADSSDTSKGGRVNYRPDNNAQVTFDGAVLKLTRTDKSFELNFEPANYQLKAGYSYRITAHIEPTQYAYDEYFKKNSNYPDDQVGDPGTEDHAGTTGFFSNNSSIGSTYLRYTQDGKTNTEDYPKPVIRLLTKKITVKKEWPGTTAAQRPESTKVALYYATDTTFSNPLTQVTLSAPDWSHEFAGLRKWKAGQELDYVIKEVGESGGTITLEAVNGDDLSYSVNYPPMTGNADDGYEQLITNTLLKGGLTITKTIGYDESGAERFTNAEKAAIRKHLEDNLTFTIYRGGNEVQTVKYSDFAGSGDTRTYNIADAEPGMYYVEEYRDGAKIASYELEVTGDDGRSAQKRLASGGTVSFAIMNTYQKIVAKEYAPAELTIRKVDDQGNLITSGVARFTLNRGSGETKQTDGGIAKFAFNEEDYKNLISASDPMDISNASVTYTLTETDAPSGYQIGNATWTVKVSAGSVEFVQKNGVWTYVYTTKVEIDGAGFDADTITLTATNKKLIDISVRKVWADNNNNDGVRPNSAWVQLYKGDAAYESPVDIGTTLSATWSNLEQFDADGNEIVYTVKELTGQNGAPIEDKGKLNDSEGNPTYTVAYSGTKDSGFIVTNTHGDAKVQVRVKKIWDDNNNQDGKRPATITVRLKANPASALPGDFKREVDLSKERDLTYVWENLPAKVNGVTVQYEVVELNGTTEVGVSSAVKELADLDGAKYEVIFNEQATDATTVRNTEITNKYQPTRIPVTVTKEWSDNDDNDGIRPASVSLALYKVVNGQETQVAGPVNVTGTGNTWTYTFPNQPEYENGAKITYVVRELANGAVVAQGGKLPSKENGKDYTASYDGLKVTNAYTPKPITKKGVKTWGDDKNNDGVRPASITITLYGKVDGKDVITPIVKVVEAPAGANTLDTWEYEFTDLPEKYQGRTIEYSIVETPVTVDGYQAPQYTSLMDVYNPYNSQTITKSGLKTWDDNFNQDGVRPASIKITLTGTIDDGNGGVKQVYPRSAADANVKVISAPDPNNNTAATWSYSFTDLPKNIEGKPVTYTIEEEVTAYMQSVGYEDPVYDDAHLNVTNARTPEKTKIVVEKKWDDNNNADGKRQNVNVAIFKVDESGNETLASEIKSLYKGDGKVTFADLDVYENGKQVTYVAYELDGANRPVKAGEKTFYDIYDVRYEDLALTDAERNAKVSKHTLVTNSYKPEEAPVEVKKIWDDADDNDGIRPDVTLQLFKELRDANGNVTGYEAVSEKVTLKKSENSGNVWTYNFGGRKFPVYENGGVRITYVVREFNGATELKVGDTLPTSRAGRVYDLASYNGLEVTNHYEPEKTEKEGVKTWGDNHNNDGKRPQSITVTLTGTIEKNGQTVNAYGPETIILGLDKVTLNAGETDKMTAEKWNYKFSNLPKYKDGVEITYAITEQQVVGYGEPVYDENRPLDVLNPFDQETTSVSGTKFWDDAGNRDGVRPDEIIVTITGKADGTEVFNETITVTKKSVYTWDGERLTLTESEANSAANNDDKWSYAVNNLPKKSGGKDIVYEVEETPVTGYGAPQQSGYDFTNPRETDKVKVIVEKNWNDGGNQDNTRKTVNFRLYYEDLDGNEVQVGDTRQLGTADDARVTITNLDKYQGVAREIKYYVRELGDDMQPVAGGAKWNVYTVSYSDGEVTEAEAADDVTQRLIITNTYEPKEIPVTVVKKWDDNANRDGDRPASVSLALYKKTADGEELVEGPADVTGTGNVWTYDFGGKLFPENENGAKIVYIVKEFDADGNEVTGDNRLTTTRGREYETAYNGLEVANKIAPEPTEREGVKTWGDNQNQDGERPTSIVVKLTGTITVEENGVEVKKVVYGPVEKSVYAPNPQDNTAETWNYKFENLPKYAEGYEGKEIVYTITEDQVRGYGAPEIDGMDVTNPYTTDTTDVSGQKIWGDAGNQDGARPTSVKVRLTGTIEKNGARKVVFDEVEFEVSAKSVYNWDGEKLVLDEDGSTILAAGDDNTLATWEYEIHNLPKKAEGETILYAVTETQVAGYGEPQVNGFNITNPYEPQKTDIVVEKNWIDDDNRDNLRKTVKVQLFKVVTENGERKEIPVGAFKTLGTTDGVKTTFTDLDVNENGAPITYVVRELDEYNNPIADNGKLKTDRVGREYTVTYDQDENGENVTAEEKAAGVSKHLKVTNAYEPEKIAVSVIKVWADTNYEDARPQTVTVELSAKTGNGDYTAITAYTYTDDDGETHTVQGRQDLAPEGWSYTWIGLNKYGEDANGVKGVEIAYRVDEVAVPAGYTKTVTGDYTTQITITNTIVKQPVDIPVVKVWDDANDYDRIRPATITVGLFANGVLEESYPLTANDKDVDGKEWSHIFKEKEQRDANGAISYAIGELREGGVSTNPDDYIINEGAYNAAYTTTVVGDTITNLHEPFEISVRKEWKGGVEGTPVTVQVFERTQGGDVPVEGRSATLSAPAWSATFTGLTKRDAAGDAIVYVVKELSATGEWVELGKVNDSYTVSVQYASDADGNVNATLQNQTITKDVEGRSEYTVNNAVKGGAFDYHIATAIPVGEGVKNFTVTDTLDDLLVFATANAADSVKVEPAGATVAVDGKTLTVRFGPADVDDTTPDLADGLKGADVKITITAKVAPGVNEEMLAAAGYLDSRVPNTASYQINNRFDTDSNTVYVVPDIEKTDIEVEKLFKGDTNNAWTGSATIGVFNVNDLTQVVKQDTVNAAKNWKVTFTGLLKHNPDGSEAKYVVMELGADDTWVALGTVKEGWTVSVSGTQEGGYKVTNQTITKTIEDEDDKGETIEVDRKAVGRGAENAFTYNLHTAIPAGDGVKNFTITDALDNALAFGGEDGDVEVFVNGVRYTDGTYLTVTAENKVLTVRFGPATVDDTTTDLPVALKGAEVKVSLKAYVENGADLSAYARGEVPNKATYRINNDFETESNEVHVVPDEKVIDVPVEKIWKNTGKIDKMPDYVTVALFDQKTDEKVSADVQLRAETEWKYTFKDMPEFRAGTTDEKIVYIVKEQDGAGNYATLGTVDGKFAISASGLTVTNIGIEKTVGDKELTAESVKKGEPFKYTIKTQIPGADGVKNFTITDTIENVLEFVDKDGNIVTSAQNANITVTPAGADVKISGKTLTVRFGPEELTYDADGNPTDPDLTVKGQDATVTFYVVVPQGADLSAYDTTNGQIPNKAEYKINNEPSVDSNIVNVTPDNPVVDVNVEKVWNNAGDSALPATVTVAVFDEDAPEKELGRLTLKAGENWKGSFENLPQYKAVGGNAQGKEINYIVKERNAADTEWITLGKYNDSFAISVDGNMKEGFKISNNGIEKEITSEVKEHKVVVAGKELDLGDSKEPFTYTLETTVPTADGTKNFTITDTLEPVLEFVEKNANAADDAAKYGIAVTPAGASVKVEGQKLTVRFGPETLSFDADGNPTDPDLTVKGQKVKIAFDAKVKNSVSEADLAPYASGRVPNKATYTINNGEDVSSNEVHATPKPKKKEIEVVKEWKGEEGVEIEIDGVTYKVENAERPGTVTVGVFANEADGSSQTPVKTAILNGANNWSAKFSDLDEFDANGKIDYTVKELAADGAYIALGNYDGKYAVAIKGTEIDGFTLTNQTITKDVNGRNKYTVNGRDDVFTYNIRTIIPDGDGVKNFVITDTLRDVLEFVSKEDGNATAGDVKLSVQPAGATVAIDGQTLKVVYGPETLSFDADGNPTDPDLGNKGAEVTISFNARVRATATEEQLAEFINGDGVDNTASFSINNEFDVDSNTVYVEPTVEYVDVVVTKDWAGETSGNVDNASNLASVNVGLFYRRDGKDTFVKQDTLRRGADGAWTLTFDGLEKTDEFGDDYVYVVKEENRDGNATAENQWIELGKVDGKYAVSVEYGTDADGNVSAHLVNQTITKDVNGEKEYSVNNTVLDGAFPYTITTAIPVGAEVESFEVTDTLEPVLEFVRVEDGKIVLNGNRPVFDAAQDVDVSLAGAEVSVSGKKLTVRFDLEDEDGNAENGIQNALKGQTLTITFYARVIPGADLSRYSDGTVATNGKIPNKASFTINNDFETDSNIVEVEPDVEYVKKEVVKHWDDDSNDGNSRPNYIVIRLLANGTEINSVTMLLRDPKNTGDDWTYTFDTDAQGNKLPKFDADSNEIEYTIEEDPIYENPNYTSVVDGMEVTNTYEPKTVDITIRKDWDDEDDRDGVRPEEVTFTLKAYAKFMGRETEVELVDQKGAPVAATVTLNANNEWGYAEDFETPWKNLPTVREQLDVTYKVTEDVDENYALNEKIKGEGYKDLAVSVDGNVTTYTYTFENVHTPKPADVEVEKVWNDADDQDGYRPEEITVTLVATVDGEAYDLTTDSAVLRGGVELTKTLSAANGWKEQWLNLNALANGGKEIKYAVVENVAFDNADKYEITYAVTGNGNDGWKATVTNEHKPEETEISVHKTWDDADDQDGKRPEEITVHLTKNGETIDTQKLNADNDWSYKWEKLDKYFDRGTVVRYDVIEEPVDEYKLTKVLTVTRADDAAYETPDAIDQIEITADTDTKHYELINSLVPGVTEVVVVKNWDDANNQDGVRPESIQMQLYADGVEVKEYDILGADGKPTGEKDNGLATLTGDDWSKKWESLPLKKAGKEIVYTVKEVDADGNALDAGGAYKITVEEGLKKGEYEYTVGYQDTNNVWTVKNTYEPKTIDLPVEKKWLDADDYDGTRPTSISVRLIAIRGDKEEQVGDVEVLSQSLNNWKYTWMGLDQFYGEGDTVEYRVEEIGYTLKDEDGKDVYYEGVAEGYAVRYEWNGYHDVETAEGEEKPVDYEQGATIENAHNPKPKKEVVSTRELTNAERTKAALAHRDDAFTYTLKAAAPEKTVKVDANGNTVEVLTKFVIRDELVEDLVFAGSVNDVKVSANGGAVAIEGQILTVTFEGAALEAIKGKEVTVSFQAKFAENADVSKYIVVGTDGIPNTVWSDFFGPDDAPTESIESEPVTITPPDPEIKKEVDLKEGSEGVVNAAKDHADLAARNEVFGYTITTEIPEREITEFVITDEVVEELGISSAVAVTVDGETVGADIATVDVKDNVITVTFGDGEYLAANAGKTVTVAFDAKIVDDANISKYFEGEENGVPNTAKYTYTLPDGKTTTKDSNKVTVTPPDPEIDKTVNGSKTTYTLEKPDEAVTYTITTQIPEKQLEWFEISDTLVDVLEFVSTKDSVKVLTEAADGSVQSLGATVTIEGKTLKARIADEYLRIAKGKKVIVEFEAKLDENATPAQLAKYLVETTAGIPNEAKYTYKVPNDPDVKEKPSDPVYIYPADPEIGKEVVNAKGESLNNEKLHADLDERYETYEYTITGEMPKKPFVASFVITDELEPVLEYVGGADQVKVTVGGADAGAGATVAFDAANPQAMTVTFDGAYVNGHLGEKISVVFNARIREGANLIDPVNYAEPNPAYPYPELTGNVRIPNKARYTINFTEESVDRRTSTGESNDVTVTPPDPDLTKEVVNADGTNADKEHLDLEEVDETFSFVLKSAVPEKQNLTSFVIEDEIEPVLEFVPAGSGNVRVAPLKDGELDEANALRSGADYTASVSGQKLTVSFSKSYIDGHMGTEIGVKFDAKVREGANLAPYKTGELREQGDALIPNTAKYTYAFNNKTVEKDSNEVDVTPKEELVEIEVEKFWEDDANRDGKRPAKITVRLFNDDTNEQKAVETIESAENGDWKVTFKDLPKYYYPDPKAATGELIKYVAIEDPVPEYGEPEYVEEVAENGRTLTLVGIHNPYEPGKTRVNVVKRWEDGNNGLGDRPASITVRLLADGEAAKDADGKEVEPLTLNEANNWRGSFTNLFINKDQGTKIVYTITEDEIENYETTIVQTDENGYAYEITNASTRGRLTVTKQLGGTVGGDVSYTFIVTNADTGAEVTRITIRGAGSETITVPAGTYRVTEVGANTSTVTGYTMITAGSGQTVTVPVGGTGTATIVNTYTRDEEPPRDTPPTTPPTTPPVVPPTPDAPPQVLGVRRTDSEAVLGARRGQTGEKSSEGRLMSMLAAGAAAMLLAISGRRKRKVDDD